MLDHFFTFLLFTPLWLGALMLLAVASRGRGLARPLWNAQRVDGLVVAHDQWLMPNGTEQAGIVVDFVDEHGANGRLIEPPVRWERTPAVGSAVRISHQAGDLELAKRYSRQRQALSWVGTLISMPVVVGFLALFPLFMAFVVVPQVAWLGARRWRPPASPVRQTSTWRGSATFDPSSIVVPTSPPLLGEQAETGGVVDHHRVGPDLLPITEALRRHFYPVVSIGVIFTVALVGASRSTHERAMVWHLSLAAVLMLGVLLFETSLAYRRGSVVAGLVVDRVLRRDSEGDVYWLEVVEFASDRGPITFVDTSGHRRQRPVGATVSVSYRSNEPQRARGLHRSQSALGIALIATAVGVGVFVSSPTWIPVLVQTAVCYAGFVVLDLVRNSPTTATSGEFSHQF